jgi:hypothetical protein
MRVLRLCVAPHLFVLTVIRDGSMWPLAVITAGGGAVIKKQTTLTYRGDNSTELYKYQKKFPEEKMGVKWIHKDGYSRPDKRTLPKKGGNKK